MLLLVVGLRLRACGSRPGLLGQFPKIADRADYFELLSGQLRFVHSYSSSGFSPQAATLKSRTGAPCDGADC